MSMLQLKQSRNEYDLYRIYSATFIIHHLKIRGNDDYTQAGNLFRIFDDGQKQRLYMNIASSMQGVPQEIIERQLVHFEKADPEYGAGVRQALKKLAN